MWVWRGCCSLLLATNDDDGGGRSRVARGGDEPRSPE